MWGDWHPWILRVSIFNLSYVCCYIAIHCPPNCNFPELFFPGLVCTDICTDWHQVQDLSHLVPLPQQKVLTCMPPLVQVTVWKPSLQPSTQDDYLAKKPALYQWGIMLVRELCLRWVITWNVFLSLITNWPSVRHERVHWEGVVDL